MVKLLVLFRKEIVKTLTKVLSDSGDYNSKTAIMKDIRRKSAQGLKMNYYPILLNEFIRNPGARFIIRKSVCPAKTLVKC